MSVQGFGGTAGQDRYRALCEREPLIPLFSQAWWLDETAGTTGWNALFDGPTDAPTAWLPYAFDRRYGFRRVLMPPLTAMLYIGLRPPEGAKAVRQHSFRMNVLAALAKQIPPYDLLDYNAHYDLEQGLPFFWQGMQLRQRYSYVWQNLTDAQLPYQAAHDSIRNAVRNSEKRLQVDREGTPAEFFELIKSSFKRQGYRASWGLPLVERLHSGLLERNQGCIWMARTASGQNAAALWLVWDNNTAYGLMSAMAPELGNVRGTVLVYWHALRYAVEELGKSRFDYLGSMHPGIEPTRRAWGGQLLPYLNLNHVPSRLLRLRGILG